MNTTQANNVTADQRRRIVEAISECNQFIAKESPRRADLRPPDVAQHLAFCIQHREKLAAMLKA